MKCGHEWKIKCKVCKKNGNGLIAYPQHELDALKEEVNELKDMLETVAAQGAFAVRCAEKAEADSERLRTALERIAKNGYARATWIAEQALKEAE
jgi:hypothetical protein